MEEREKTSRELLEEELVRQLNYLSSSQVGSEESKAIIDDCTQLSKMIAEQDKLKNEEEKIQNDKEVEESKLKQAEEKQAEEWANKELDRKEEKKSRKWEHILQGIGIGTSVAIAVIGQVFASKQLGTLLRFESTGEYVTSFAGKSLIGSLFRKK